MDPDGNPVPRGTIGEVVARGPFLMEGYFEDEEETARYFRDGWGWTGDLAKCRRRRLPHAWWGDPGRVIISGRFQHPPLRGRDRAREPPRRRGLHRLRRPGRALGGRPRWPTWSGRAEVTADDSDRSLRPSQLARYKRPPRGRSSWTQSPAPPPAKSKSPPSATRT